MNIDQSARLASVGNYAFAECTSLKAMPLTENITNIGKRAFFKSGLQKVRLPVRLLVLESGTFEDCTNLETAHLNDRVTKIQKRCFMGSGLKNITIPPAVEIIDAGAFMGCRHLEEVRFVKDSKLVEIGDFAFMAAGLRMFKAPS